MATSGGNTVGNITAVDVIVIVAYFVLVMAFGLWSSCKNRGSVGGYFLAGRSMHFVLIGASLFASNIGSGHFIGLAGSGASSGIGVAAFELNAIFILLILGWIFVPVYISSGVYTMPEYIRKRFGGQRIRVYLAVLALILSIFTKVASAAFVCLKADLYAGAVFINQAMSLSIYVSIVLLLAVAALFSIAGGLTAVIWTDFIQTVVMILGATYLMVVGFVEVGGYNVIVHRYFEAAANTTVAQRIVPWANQTNGSCGWPPENSFNLIRSATDPGQPWPGVMFGLTISSVWYWCSDQVIVQRALAAKNYSHAKAGCILAGYLKFLPMWIIIIPGMISRILFPDEIACTDPDKCFEYCGSRAACTNIAYPLLVIRLMPDGARGLMLAVMMSALMSSLTSIFNSSSTIFTVDIWTRFRKNAGEMELMVVSRLFVCVMAGLGVAWIPIVNNFTQLFDYIQSVTSFLAPPICAVYVLAVLWKRTNEQGAFWGLMIGLVIGLIRFAWESAYSQVGCGADDPRPAIIKDVHYLYFGVILFVIVLIVVVVVSLFTQPIEDKYLVRLTYWDRYSDKKREELPDEPTNASSGAGSDEPTNASRGAGSDEPPDEPQNIEASAEKPKLTWYRVSFNWICGIEDHPELAQVTEAERKEAERRQTSLEEEPRAAQLCSINALILSTCTIFFWGFFAQLST